MDISLGTNRSISFGDTFLGVWTFLSAQKKYKYLPDDAKYTLYVRDPAFLFLKEWFPQLSGIEYIDRPSPYSIDIHLHSTQFFNQSKDCPWGYFINHKLTYDDLIPINIAGKEVQEIKSASGVLFKEMGKWMQRLSIDPEDVNYIIDKTNVLLNEKNLLNHPLQDVLYTIHKYNIPVISYRNGLCDYFFLTCKNNLSVIYPSAKKAPEWLREAKLCTTFLEYKNTRCINVKEIYEEDIRNEW